MQARLPSLLALDYRKNLGTEDVQRIQVVLDGFIGTRLDEAGGLSWRIITYC
jgi:hypothetical protein